MNSRRRFFKENAIGVASLALPLMLTADGLCADINTADRTHHEPTAKNIIYMCQIGAPSQFDMFDRKPVLNERDGEEFLDLVCVRLHWDGLCFKGI